MCFTKTSVNQVAITAQTDIYGVKYLRKRNDELVSPYRSRKCTWKLNVPKKAAKFDALTKDTYSVNIGLHCHRLIDRAMTSLAGRTDGKVFLVKIPKGALYYFNNTEFCSNQMVLIKDITPAKKKK